MLKRLAASEVFLYTENPTPSEVFLYTENPTLGVGFSGA